MTPRHLALFNKANEYLAQAQEYFTKAIRQIAKSKRFTPEQIELFDGCIETDSHKRENEIIFNGDFVNLEVKDFSSLSKKELINKMWDFINEENRTKLRPSYKSPEYA